jgi:hypothetical protein
VLAAYRHLEDIPLEAKLWKVPVRGADRLVSAMREHMSDALLFRYLARLRRDVPLDVTAASLEWKGVPQKRFLEFCDRYDFDTLRSRPTRWR